MVDPRARSATIGSWTISGWATARLSRSRISRLRGPGISVRTSITRVAATRGSIVVVEDPIALVQAWLDEALSVDPELQTMTLATATPDGKPSARVVLLRGLDSRGLVFFTNRESRKGQELRQNPRAAVALHWWELGRQLRVEGAVEEVSEEESVAYWETRPRGSQVAAWASRQSQELADRSELDARVAEAA